MTKFNFKPGDLIEWVYVRGGRSVIENEQLYSTIEQDYVPIGSGLVHVCVERDNETYSWLNEDGLFRASVDDTVSSKDSPGSRWVVPRARG